VNTVAAIQPDDIVKCIRGVAEFTCVLDRNNTNIDSDDVRWERLKSGRSRYKTISRSGTIFNITTTASEDIITSKLTITRVRRAHIGLYHCVVPATGVMSRNASLKIVKGKMCGTVYIYSA